MCVLPMSGAAAATISSAANDTQMLRVIADPGPAQRILANFGMHPEHLRDQIGMQIICGLNGAL